MRALAIASMLLLAACSSGTSSNDNGDGGTSGTTSTDGGSSGTDGGVTDGGTSPTPCTEGDTEACTGSTDGTCDPGVRTCTGGAWGPCDGRAQPQPGLCDFPSCAGGLNTGCDCQVGTFQECHTQATTTLGHGTCTAGFQTCVATATGSAWGDCEGEVLPATDDCSGRELNCGSGAAVTCTCTEGDSRPCGGVTGGSCQLGVQRCTGGSWGACEGAVQPIKGDCGDPSCLSNGGTEVPNPGCECVIGEGEPCYTGPDGSEGTGTCAAGTRTCDASGQWGACVGQVHPLPTCDIPSCTGTPQSSCE